MSGWSEDSFQFKGWKYGGENYLEPVEFGAIFGSVCITYTYLGSNPDSVGTAVSKPSVASDAGYYRVNAKVAGTDNYDGLYKEYVFEITKQVLEVGWEYPTMGLDTTGGVNTLYGFDEDLMTYSSLDGVDIVYEGGEIKITVETNGEFGVILTLKNEAALNYMWAGESSGEQSTVVTFLVTDVTPIDGLITIVDPDVPMVYTGYPITKSVVSDLLEGQDFIVSYQNNVNRGTASMLIVGMGLYTGSIQCEFEIIAASPTVVFYNESLKMYVEDNPFINAIDAPDYIEGYQFSSSDPDVASVDPTTGAITMNAVGTTTITVTVPSTNNYAGTQASYELTVSDHPVEVVDHVVYVKVPVEVPDGDDDDDQTDDKPETVYIEKDNDLYIWLLIVMAVICVCFAAYILYSHRDQEGGA